LAAVC